MSRFAFWQSRWAVAAVAAVLVLGSGFLVWSLGSDDDVAAPNIAAAPSTSAAPSEDPTSTPTPTPTPSASPTGSPTCEGPDTQFNVEGVQQDSLLPDCGAGLALSCGGDYPVILYKTRTADTKSSICGVDSSGQKLRVVVAVEGEPPRDLKGSYEYQLDAFVAKDDNTTYVIRAYDGTIVIQRESGTRTEKSLDWISLDNESDGEAESSAG